MDELELDDEGLTAEEAPCICAHGDYRGTDIDKLVASIPGTYDECEPKCGKCYWSYQDYLSLDY